MNQTQPKIEPFSAAYDIVWNASVEKWPADEAAMDRDMFSYLSQKYAGDVVVRVGGLTYYMKPEAAMPAQSVAVPEDNHDDPQAVLVQR